VTASITDCMFCIDTQMPAGRDDAVGELFERCPECTQPCPHCHGVAVYPANYNTPLELAADLAVLRYAPVFCLGCTGLVALTSLDTTEDSP
jgi:hypothetical protein